MKNRILLLKMIACAVGIVLLTAGDAQAQLVFDENFDGQSIFVSQANPLDFGGAASEVGVEQWFSASNGVAINDELQLTNFDDSRSRGAGIWLDSSAWAPGTVTVEFDVLDYAAGGTDSVSFFQAFFANGVDGSNSVGLDVHAGGAIDPRTTFTGTATIGTVGAQNTISGDGPVSFSFNFTGQENIALVFHNSSGVTGAQPVYSVDNLTVTVVSDGSLLGDFDMDGDVDLVDLDQYIGNIGASATGALAALDFNGDGTVGADDFAQHYTDLVQTSNGGTGTFAGDANLDGQVNVLGDAFALVANLGNASTSWSQGDFNGDGTVNVLGDAFLLVANIGMDNGGAAGP